MTINCHQYSEGSDFLGGLRPVRSHHDDDDGDVVVRDVDSDKEKDQDRLFEWVDGPLVRAMVGGHFFLAGELAIQLFVRFSNNGGVL